MKKYTREEIMETLVENQSMEFEYGKVFYYIHVAENGSLLPSTTGAEDSIRIQYKGEALEDYDHESEENIDFMEMVEKFTEIMNEGFLQVA